MANLGGLKFTMMLERALRRASQWHAGQTRKGSQIPYIAHPFGVAILLDRFGFGDDVIIAGLLHDVVEDTIATLEDVRTEFGDEVAMIVAACSEEKTDSTGRQRPWSDRKRDYLNALANASIEARAVALADKLHNLTSIEFDLDQGRPVWTLFSASRPDVIAYYRSAIARLGHGEQLVDLAASCQEALARVERHNGVKTGI